MRSRQDKLIVLIQPSEPFGKMAEVPVSIIGIAAVLQQASYKVKILDARLDDLSVMQLMRKIKQEPPQVVGITGLNNAYRFIKDFCFEFKRVFPNTPLIAGGQFIQTQAELLMPRLPIDVACIGEGEEIVVELVEKLLTGEDLSTIPNIAYKKGNQIIKTPLKLIEDFDSLPFPAYELLDVERYINESRVPSYWYKNYFPITTGRGCVHHCYFCGRPFSKVRRQSPQRLLEHMDFLHRTYGIDAFLFSEDSALYPKEWIRQVLNLLIERGSPYYLNLCGCPEQITEDIVALFEKAKVMNTAIAVEHWDPLIQKKFFRSGQSKYLMRAFELLKKYRVRNDGFALLWGHPEDNLTTYREAYKKSREVADHYQVPHVWLTSLVIYPNSKLQEDALKMGHILDYESYMYALGGYAPHVNLTEEDDDQYRGFFVEQMLINEIQLVLEGLNILHVDNKPFPLQLVNYYRMHLASLTEQLLMLRALLSMPKEERDQYRSLLEQILGVPMYDPHKNYYHEIGCFKEVLALKPGWRVAAYGLSSFNDTNLIRLFNSVRESRVTFVGFVDLIASIDSYEDYPLVSLANLDKLNPQILLLPMGREDNTAVTKLMDARWKEVFVVPISKQSMLEIPWNVRAANSAYYNPKLYQITLENGQFVRRVVFPN